MEVYSCVGTNSPNSSQLKRMIPCDKASGKNFHVLKVSRLLAMLQKMERGPRGIICRSDEETDFPCI
jgi:hypothetical protein